MWFQHSKVIFLLFALLRYTSALSLLEVLATEPDLSTLFSRVNGSKVLAPLLRDANEYTLFAPSNNAIDTFLKAQPNATSEAAFEALIQYSLIKNAFTAVAFTETPQFAKSNLLDAKYSNVTGGQVVELVVRDGQPQVVSGNSTGISLSKPDLVAAGGVIHIIDQPLILPLPAVNAISTARLGYMVSILTRGGYLERATNAYVHEILDATDVTYFIPNTAAALSNFTAVSTNWKEDDFKQGFQYHVIPKYVGYSDNLMNNTVLTTYQGMNLTVYTNGGDTYVNGAKVIATNLFVANGVVHVIDQFLDRNAAAPPAFLQKAWQSSNTSGAETSSSSPIPSPTAEPTPTPSTAAPTTSKNNQALKIGLGAGLGGAALLALLAILFFCLRRRRSYNRKLPPPNPNANRESSAWDDHTTPTTSPSDPKRYFVNRDGVVQQRPEREGIVAGRLADRNSGGPPGYVPPSMVTVTNLERGDAANRYYGGNKRAEENAPPTPMKSPSRSKVPEGQRSYFL